MTFTQEYRIRSSWAVRAAAGEPFAVVHVRDLQAVVQAGQDAWGRDGRPQPLLVSADVSLAKPFAAAAYPEASDGGDRVGSDTVHYGALSKAILASLEGYHPQRAQQQHQQQHQQQQQPPPSASGPGRSGGVGGGGSGAAQGSVLGSPGPSATTLRGVLETIWTALTSRKVDGLPCRRPGAEVAARPFLDISRLRFLSLTVRLPKASLQGEGVSLTASSVFAAEEEEEEDDKDRGRAEPGVEMFGIALKVHRLRVPTLIGVNDNERLAKQMVVADVEIDKFDCHPDVYTRLEALVVKTMDESSFETLEALGAHLSRAIMADFKPQPGQKYAGYFGWQVKIGLEKPIAVPLADGPSVEIRSGADMPPAAPPFHHQELKQSPTLKRGLPE